MGFYSRGSFKGFDSRSIQRLLWAWASFEVTAGNRRDSPIMSRLLKGMGRLEAVGRFRLRQRGELEAHRGAWNGALPIIARNRRNEKEGRFKKEAPSATKQPSRKPLFRSLEGAVSKKSAVFAEQALLDPEGLIPKKLYLKDMGNIAAYVLLALTSPIAIGAIKIGKPELMRRIGLFKY